MCGSDEKVVVNGAEMDREFFEANVKEAKTLSWSPGSENEIEEHMHCIVCWMSLPSAEVKKIYKSGPSWICGYCYDHFVVDSE